MGGSGTCTQMGSERHQQSTFALLVFLRILLAVYRSLAYFFERWNWRKLELIVYYRSVTDPRDGKKVALKKMPNVFGTSVSARRVFRELKMLCYFKHENVSFCDAPIWLKRLYHKEDNHLLIFCVFSRGRSSDISQKYNIGNFWEYFKRLRKRSIWVH